MWQKPSDSPWYDTSHANLVLGGMATLMLRNVTVFLAVLLFSPGCGSLKFSGPGGKQMEANPAPIVWLEPDLTITTTPEEFATNTHPFRMNASELANVLRGIRVSSGRGFLRHVSPERAFSDEEVELLSPLLTEALGRASRWERVVFKFEHAESAGGETLGALFVRGSYLHFVLAKHRVFNREDPEGAATREHRIFFDRDDYLAPAGIETLVKWSESDRTHLSINHQRLRTELTEPQKSDVPRVQQTAVSTFQQMQEPTQSNLDLSEKLKTLQEDLDRNRQQVERLSLELDQAKHTLREKDAELKQLQEQRKLSKEPKPRTPGVLPPDSQRQ
jgi:hypothetical protein